MTQIASTPTTPSAVGAGQPGGAVSTATSGAAERRAQSRRHYFTGTPGRMRLMAAIASALCLAFALAGFTGLRGVQTSVDRASANTEQVVRARAIYADLLAADAAVTNGFLVGGLESAASRKTYDEAMARVAENIATAASAQGADGKALAALNEKVQNYAANIDRARTYNREGKPVGAQYLRIAGTDLRAQALPIADAVATANEGRAEDAYGIGAPGWLALGTGLVALGGLLAIAVWLARRTHRYVNLPLTAAILLVGAALGLAAWHVTQVANTLNDARNGEYKAATALAQARAAAYDAKANESLTLIARGSGQTFEKAYQDSSAKTLDKLQELVNADPAQDSLRSRFGAYTVKHSAIRKADDSGDWTGAVKLATSDAADSANDTFRQFDQAASTVLAQEVKSITTAFDRIGGWLLPWVAGGAAALAALLAGRSMSRRIEEYR